MPVKLRAALDLVARVAWAGPLLVRVALAAIFIPSGWGKLHHLAQVEQYFASLHIPAPGAQAAMVSVIELVAGIAVLLGLGTRVAGALLVAVMTVAIYTAKWPAIHSATDLAATVEFAYLAMAAWLVTAGAGAASADHLLGRAWAAPRR
ncbi:MAG: DoxX family protein [Kofleriaceae bacterium]